MNHINYAWQLLESKSFSYDDLARTDLISLIQEHPGRCLELGCHAGKTGEVIKEKFDNVHYTGVEINPHTSAIAKSRLDKVITDELSATELVAHPDCQRPFDTIIAADVLEHLYNPWSYLEQFQSLLTPQGKIYLSIPNSRNYWLIEQLICGHWSYESAGLLDITHIRFFTLTECLKMFHQTGYQVLRCESVADSRIHFNGDFHASTDTHGKHFSLHNVDAEMLKELSTLQFLFVIAKNNPMVVNDD
ncbi:MAG: class I SAM-dependent methyltransferase [Gammaproteobacteria bacterium]|nr:class I SAM-dependent methyltransferase [Gammaproteobacteria bacterium]